MKFNNPWTVRFGENVTLGADMGKLIFLELFVSLDVH
jgi:hypothetical protein